MHDFLASAYTELKYLLWPYLCACCKQFLYNDTLLCSACVRTINPIISVQVSVTARRTMAVFAMGAYQGPLKRLILAKGWQDQRASVVLGKLLWRHTTLPYCDFDIIVPIPLHWTRFAYRGYNQALVMAKQLSMLSGKPVCQALQRSKHTVFQSTLSSSGRKDNVKNVFEVGEAFREQLRDKRILLVDDLMTSGATLQSAGKALNRCRPAAINATVACRVV